MLLSINVTEELRTNVNPVDSVAEDLRANPLIVGGRYGPESRRLSQDIE